MGSFEDVHRDTLPTGTGAVGTSAVETGAVGNGASVGVESQSVDAELAALSDLPLAERAAVFERLHTRLQSALSAIDA